MRPRRVRRGKVVSHQPLLSQQSGFNEAPASSPGKGGINRNPKASAMRRFNEAPASSPGKARALLGWRAALCRLQ